MIVDKTLGNKCFIITLDGLQPMDTAARTYSFSFSDRILLRTIRAIPPQLNKLIVAISTHTPLTLPNKIAFNTMTNTKNGKVKIKSVKRINKLSTIPPKYPAMDPTMVPNRITKNVHDIPINKEILPPNSNRVNMSLPDLSVPKKCSVDGGKLRSGKFTLVIS